MRLDAPVRGYWDGPRVREPVRVSRFGADFQNETVVDCDRWRPSRTRYRCANTRLRCGPTRARGAPVRVVTTRGRVFQVLPDRAPRETIRTPPPILTPTTDPTLRIPPSLRRSWFRSRPPHEHEIRDVRRSPKCPERRVPSRKREAPERPVFVPRCCPQEGR